MSIEIFTKMIERVGLKEEAQILLPAIANRLNKTPFPEPCKLASDSLIDFSRRSSCRINRPSGSLPEF